MGWTLIDNVSVLKLAFSPVPTLKRFTKNQYSMIARILVEVREYTDQAWAAGDDTVRERGLLWQRLLPNLLLHSPEKVGLAATGSLIGERVKFWHEGYDGKSKLVQAWAKRYDEWAPPEHSYEEGGDFIGLSKLTNAMDLLSSKGMEAVAEEPVCAQLQEKHPVRTGEISSLPSLLNGRQVDRVEVKLRKAMQKLQSECGTSYSGWRNTHLRGLAASFRCIEAKKVVPCLEEYGTQFASGELPGWEYVLLQIAKLVALRKLSPVSTPARPVGIGCCLGRLISSAAISAYEKGGQCEQVLAMLEEVKEREGIEPNEYIYSAAISACAKEGQWEQALALLEEAKEREGIEPKVRTYSAAISACAKGGQWEQALALLEEVKEREGIEPNAATYNAALDAVSEQLLLARTLYSEARDLKLYRHLQRSFTDRWFIDLHEHSEGAAITAARWWIETEVRPWQFGEDARPDVSFFLITGYGKTRQVWNTGDVKAAVAKLLVDMQVPIDETNQNRGTLAIDRSRWREQEEAASSTA
jgi:pentatricopeptide repeat protein